MLNCTIPFGRCIRRCCTGVWSCRLGQYVAPLSCFTLFRPASEPRKRKIFHWGHDREHMQSCMKPRWVTPTQVVHRSSFALIWVGGELVGRLGRAKPKRVAIRRHDRACKPMVVHSQTMVTFMVVLPSIHFPFTGWVGGVGGLLSFLRLLSVLSTTFKLLHAWVPSHFAWPLSINTLP